MDLNFNQLAKDCLINTTDNVNESFPLIDNLEKNLNQDDFINVINYFFQISNNSDILNYIIKKMNKYKSKTSVPILIDFILLKDKYHELISDIDVQTSMRVGAVKVLANIKDNSAVNPLLHCLNNKNENYKLRLSCAEALGKIGDKYAVTPLTDVLKDDNEHSVYLKESAAFALGMIGDKNAVDTLVNILETQKGIIDKFTFLKERAIEALSKINFKNDKVFSALKNSLKDESEQVRINAIEALSNLDDNRVEEVLYNCLFDKSEEVLKNVVIALYNISGDDIFEKILNDSSLPEITLTTTKDIIKELNESDDEI